MRKVIYTILVCWVVVFAACSEMNDLHQPYLDEGEKIYAAKVDSVLARPGNKRLALDIYMPTQRVERGIIVWNNNADTLRFEVNRGRDEYQRILIENLVEGSYIFTFVMYDAFGNQSLPYEVVGAVYGEDYASSLLNRTIEKLEKNGNDMIITWRESGESNGLLFTYTNVNNKQVDLEIPADEMETVINDANPGSTFSYITYFYPVDNAIDSFPTSSRSGYFPFERVEDRSGWSVLDCSDERPDDGGGKDAILDDNLDTYWHSQWGPDMPLPHWLLIDLGEEYTIGGVEIIRRNSNTNTKKLKFEVSMDNVTFVEAGEMDFGGVSNVDRSKTVTFPAVSGRYLKCWIVESNSAPHANIAEFFILGTKSNDNEKEEEKEEGKEDESKITEK